MQAQAIFRSPFFAVSPAYVPQLLAGPEARTSAQKAPSWPPGKLPSLVSWANQIGSVIPITQTCEPTT